MFNIKKIYIVFTIFSVFLFTHTYAKDEINISPIVQVISYTDIYWKYPQMMWWWSASIINKEWVILSNDHVVDDGKGALASAFSICITKNLSEKPVCDYTASLIARDDKLDISLLKIDEVDIYGNKVDYSKFKMIDVDYDYIPKNQDETIAIWYPWVWADTISETKWIVSWISEYNGYKYIKTDTLIAGGNSGWAFLRNWKLIWVPTFWIWWWGDNTMWYALSISEAKDFINENISQPSKKSNITSILDFNSYRKTIENINNSLKLQDDVFDIKLPSDYQVSNYIKNTSLNIELKRQKDTGVSYFSLYLEKLPKIKSEKEKLYYFETLWLYQKEWQKLVKKNINGIEYYYPVDKTDLSNWGSNWWNNYFSVQNGYLINIFLTAPFYDEKRNKEVKVEVDNLLNSIKINTNNFSKLQANFSTNVPKIDIKNINTAIVDTWKYKVYLGNLYEKFEVYVNELMEYNGKGKTAKEIYDVQLKDVYDSQKSLISFDGLDGFINCWNSPYGDYYNYYYNYNWYYWYNNNIWVDENNNPITLETCDINIYFPINKELNRHNYLTLKLTSLKNTKEKNLSIAIDFLKKYLKVEWTSGEINIPNILSEQNKLKFKDISNQTEEYKNFLKILVRYKMINNTNNLNWDSPIKWWDYLSLYTKYVYKFDIDASKCNYTDYKCKFAWYKVWENSLDTIFSELWIKDYNEYIDSNKISDFDTVFLYKLAWVNIGEYNMNNFRTFQNLINDEKYILEKKKLDTFNNSIYGNKKILLYDFYTNYNTYYFSLKTPQYYPEINKLVYVDNNVSKIDFSSKRTDLEQALSNLYKNNKCYLKKTYLESYNCSVDAEKKYIEIQKKYLENKELAWLDDEYYFVPLKKADALSKIFEQVDFWLFDENLAKKKDTVISE